MFELEATADMLLPTPQAKASTDTPETRIEVVLVKAVLAGDRDSFGRLYELYAPMVHGILLHAFRKLHTLRDWAAFGPWIAMIARNRAMDFYRRTKETVEVTEDLRSTDMQTSRANEILELIRALPEAYQETLILRLVEGMTGPEIAARTGLTPASVRVNLHRGMKQLRKKLGYAEAL